MCGRYELSTEFEKLPSILKGELPKGFEENYEKQSLIRPNDPVLVLKNEGKTSSSLMLWGLISEWSKAPFASSKPRPFNVRAETVALKPFFQRSWRYKRCLLPASGFFEKGHRIKRKDSKTFWLAGIWNRWMDSEGSEIETCCVLTTAPNRLLSPLHNRMPVIIPNGVEEDWIASIKSGRELKELETLLNGWNPDDWIAEPIIKATSRQMNLF